MDREAEVVCPAGRAEPEGSELLEALAEVATDAIVVCRRGYIVWASPRTAELLGGSPDRLEGEAVARLIGPEPRPGDPEGVECEARAAAGRRLRVRRQRIGGELEAQEVWLIQDVTRERNLEAEARDASRTLLSVRRDMTALEDRLRRHGDEREELLGVISHELRTPATVIGGYARLLLSEEPGPLTPEQRRFLEETMRSCRRLDHFLGSLLDLSAQGRGEAELALRRVELEPLLRGLLGFLRPLLEERALAMRVRVEAGAEWVRCDADRVEQVLTNLLGNAIKYSKEGGLIEIAAEPRDEEERRLVLVSVSDSGSGIASEDRGRIFEPYVRVDAEGRRGLGLGLAICKRIVEAHGGRIGVDDRARGGTRFHLPKPAGEAGGAG